jgi:hypothetical protein
MGIGGTSFNDRQDRLDGELRSACYSIQPILRDFDVRKALTGFRNVEDASQLAYGRCVLHHVPAPYQSRFVMCIISALVHMRVRPNAY